MKPESRTKKSKFTLPLDNGWWVGGWICVWVCLGFTILNCLISIHNTKKHENIKPTKPTTIPTSRRVCVCVGVFVWIKGNEAQNKGGTYEKRVN